MSINVGNLAGGIELNDALSSALEKIHARLTLTGVDFQELDKKVQASSTVFGQAANVQTQLQAELAKSQILVAGYTKSLDDATKVAMTGARAAKELQPVIQAEAQALLQAKSQADALRASMKLLDKEFNTVKESAQITSQQIVAFGRGMQEAGVVVSTAFSIPIAAAGAASLSFAGDFEKAMTKASILGGLTANEMKAFESTVISTAETMGKAPAEVALGLDVIGSAMYKGAEAAGILEKATKMSALGMGTVEETTRAVVGAMLAYKNENLDAAAASDILLKTVQLGNMKIGDLVGALAKINPLAAAMGVKFADVNAAIATFTHLGAPAEVAATGVRAVLSNILNDSAKTEKGLKALNISMVDLQAAMRDNFAKALTDLVAAAEKVPGGMAKLNDVFPNIRALTLVLADAKAQGESFLDTANAIRNSAGTLDTAFTQVQQTWAQQWNEFKASLEAVGIQFGQALMPMLKTLISFITDYALPAVKKLIDLFTSLPQPLQIAGIAFGGFLIAGGPVLIYIGEMVRAWGHLSAAMKTETFKNAIAGLTALGERIVATTTFAWALNTALLAVGASAIAAGIYGIFKIVEQFTLLQAENANRASAASRQATVDESNLIRIQEQANKVLGEKATKFKDLNEAVKWANENSAKLRTDDEILNFVMGELADSQNRVSETSKIWAAEADIAKFSTSNLSVSMQDLVKKLFDVGMSSAEAVTFLKEHNLFNDEMKVGIENLHEAYTKEQKALKDVADAELAAHMASVPLYEAQEKEVRRLLDLGLGHKQIADYLGVHIAQVNALVKVKADEEKSLKAELKAIDDLEKEWNSYYKDKDLLGATDSEKIRIKADADYAKIVEKLQDAGVAQVEYYNQAWALRELDIKKEEESRILKDTKSKAHLDQELREAKDKYDFMRMHSDQYHAADIENQKKSVEHLKSMRDHWYDVGHAIDKNIEKVRTLSGEILTLKEYEARQLAGGTFDVTSQNFEQTARGLNLDIRRATELAHKGYSLQEIVQILNSKATGPVPPPQGPKIPGFIEGGVGDFKAGTLAMLHGREAIVPLDKAGYGGKVNIEAGAFVFQYPIMKDRRSMEEFASVIDEVLSNRLMNMGARN